MTILHSTTVIAKADPHMLLSQILYYLSHAPQWAKTWAQLLFVPSLHVLHAGNMLALAYASLSQHYKKFLLVMQSEQEDDIIVPSADAFQTLLGCTIAIDFPLADHPTTVTVANDFFSYNEELRTQLAFLRVGFACENVFPVSFASHMTSDAIFSWLDTQLHGHDDVAVIFLWSLKQWSDAPLSTKKITTLMLTNQKKWLTPLFVSYVALAESMNLLPEHLHVDDSHSLSIHNEKTQIYVVSVA